MEPISAKVTTRNNEPRLPLKMKREMLEKQIRDLKSLGWSYEEIAKVLNVSKTTIFKVLKKTE